MRRNSVQVCNLDKLQCSNNSYKVNHLYYFFETFMLLYLTTLHSKNTITDIKYSLLKDKHYQPQSHRELSFYT